MEEVPKIVRNDSGKVIKTAEAVFIIKQFV